MAETFPNSQFIGYDFHEASIMHAQQRTNGLANVRFATARAEDYEDADFETLGMSGWGKDNRFSHCFR